MTVPGRRLSYALGAFILACGMGVALALSYWLALRQLQGQSQTIAQALLKRTEEISVQVDRAFDLLESTAAGTSPCSEAGIRRMQEVALNSTRLQIVGYASGGRLLCSSYGRHEPPIDLGPPTYVSRLGFEVRASRALPIAGDTRFLISTLQRTGYTVAVLPQLNTDFMSDRAAHGLGMYGASARRPMHTSGALDERWLQLLPEGRLGISQVDQGLVVTVRRSQRYDYAAYVAMPLTALREDWFFYATVLVPIGAATGLAIGVLAGIVLRNRRSLNHQLRRALRRRDGLCLHFQPIVELATGRWVGAEALLRWRLPDGTQVPPDAFVPMAERTGQIRRLTSRMLELLERDVAPLWKAHPDFYVSINFSAQDLMDAQAIADLQALLARTGAHPRQLLVEVTERVLVDDEASQQNLNRLRKAGIRVAIDDFGTGYCGLAYLTRLELDALKIDKVFVDTIGTDAATRHVVGHIIEIGKSLGLGMIAEGVESAQHADYLRQQGVGHAQGWLYARPMPCGELRERLSQAAAPPPA